MTKIFLATLLAFTATPALAEPPALVTSTVQTADLDLSSSGGQRALDRRLALAAKDVCGTASNVDPAGQNDVRKCARKRCPRFKRPHQGLPSPRTNR